MGKDNTIEHPSTILRREVEELKKEMKRLERKLDITEQALVEVVHKYNTLQEGVLKLTNLVTQPETPKRKRSTRTDD